MFAGEILLFRMAGNCKSDRKTRTGTWLMLQGEENSLGSILVSTFTRPELSQNVCRLTKSQRKLDPLLFTM